MRIDRIKFVSALARSGITQKELSARTGITPATITAVKGGKNCYNGTANRLAEGLGVPLSELVEDNRRAG